MSKKVGWIIRLRDRDQWVLLCLQANKKCSTRRVHPGPVIFNIVINDLEETTDSTLVEFSGNTKLEGRADNLCVKTVIWGDLDR